MRVIAAGWLCLITLIEAVGDVAQEEAAYNTGVRTSRCRVYAYSSVLAKHGLGKTQKARIYWSDEPCMVIMSGIMTASLFQLANKRIGHILLRFWN